MKNLANHTLKEYSQILSKKEPVPGGGSAAALTASLGTSLISMVANYSLNRGKGNQIDNRIKTIIKKNEVIRKRLLELVDLDAKAYLQVVKSRKSSAAIKRKAKNMARKVPLEVSKLCHQSIQLVPYLVKHGNPYLVSDIEVAAELLLAGYNSALINVEINS